MFNYFPVAKTEQKYIKTAIVQNPVFVFIGQKGFGKRQVCFHEIFQKIE